MTRISSNYQSVIKILSLLSLFRSLQLSISQPFKIKTITDIMRIFEKLPLYDFKYRVEMQEKFDLLCEFEDKTYFQRKKSYSCISSEYFRCVLVNHNIYNVSALASSLGLSQDLLKNNSGNIKDFKFSKRGYSTPEMQLLRTIGIVRGYDRYKISRKIFEVIYSKLFFSSLKEYHKANSGLSLEYYRHYLLYIYFQTVLTKINGKRCSPLSSVFANSEDLANWSMNGLFVACLGLSFHEVSDDNLCRYTHIIDKFNLDSNVIRKISENFKISNTLSEC